MRRGGRPPFSDFPSFKIHTTPQGLTSVRSYPHSTAVCVWITCGTRAPASVAIRVNGGASPITGPRPLTGSEVR